MVTVGELLMPVMTQKGSFGLFIHSSKVLASSIELISFFIKCGFPYEMA